MGVGWIADGVFNTGTDIELTKVWSALAGYEHIWNPKWRTSVVGGYVNVDYSSAATNVILQHSPGAFGACGVAAAGGGHSPPSLCCRQQLQPGLQLLGSLIRAPSGTRCRSSISVWKCFTPNAIPPSKARRPCPANGSRPAVVNGVIDDQNVWSAMFRWQRNFYP